MTLVYLNAIITEHSVRTECSVTIMSIMQNTSHLKFSNLSTKERILKAAFELSSIASVKNVSLNDIAKKAGIAKPGIFRYYKNKEDLQETMKDRFFDDFCAYISTLPHAEQNDIKSFKNREKSLLEWFIDRNDYLLFFLNTLVGNGDIIPVFIREMQKRNIGNAKSEHFTINEINKKTISKKLYLRTTEIFFLLARVFCLSQNPNWAHDTNVFTDGFTTFLVDGWEDLEEISETRIAELDSVCTIKSNEFPQESKMFQALSALLETNAFSEITVEKMATELGMAKSSLYSHFTNKDEMIKTLIEEELFLMLKTMHKTLQHGKTFSEYIYLHLRSQMEYLAHRTRLVPVCNRLSVQGFLPEKLLENFFENIDSDYKKNMVQPYPFSSIGFPVDGFIIGGWFFSLCVSAFKFGSFFNLEQKKIIECITDYYYCMKNGLKNSLTE